MRQLRAVIITLLIPTTLPAVKVATHLPTIAAGATITIAALELPDTIRKFKKAVKKAKKKVVGH